MDEKNVQEILHDLFSSLEKLDTQSSAILQFLKEKGIAKEEDLAPYMERAGNASNVRWLAARVRIDHLLSAAIKSTQDRAKQEAPKAAEKAAEQKGEPHPNEKESSSTKSGENAEGTEPAAATGKAPVEKPENHAPKEPSQEDKQKQSNTESAA